jgi:hypothetical protein
MSTIQKIAISLGFLLAISLTCQLTPTKERSFENENLAFTIPAGWQTMDEIWDRPATPGRDYYALGLGEIVMIQYPPERGKGKVFFAVASSPLADGQDLESRFTQAYQVTTPEIEDASKQAFELGGYSGYEIIYKRPWGEPWWQFRDIWLEKDGVIYVLSFHAPPNSLETYSDTFNQILESFRFKD